LISLLLRLKAWSPKAAFFLVNLLILSGPTPLLAQGEPGPRPKLQRLILDRGLIDADGKYVSTSMRLELAKIAREEGAEAMRQELQNAGAICSDQSAIRQCKIETSMTIRSLDLFFPKYTKLTWHVNVRYIQEGRSISDVWVTASRADRRLWEENRQ
jgi:hypothetical protein